MTRSFGVDTMWTAAAVLLVELMRMVAATVPRARHALLWLRWCSSLLLATVVLGLAILLLDATDAPRILHVAVAVAAVGVDVAALPCLVLGVAYLVSSGRPPGSHRRRQQRSLSRVTG